MKNTLSEISRSVRQPFDVSELDMCLTRLSGWTFPSTFDGMEDLIGRLDQIPGVTVLYQDGAAVVFLVKRLSNDMPAPAIFRAWAMQCRRLILERAEILATA